MKYLAVLFMLIALIGCDSSSSYQSDYDYDSGGSGSSDTSESHRRNVRDKMVGQGSDPAEAEAFTSELFKAQREWEAGNK